MTRRRSFVAAAAMVLVLGACATPPDQSAAAVAAVRAADSAWADAFARKDLTAYLAFVDSAAVIQAPNAGALRGQAAIRSFMEGFLALPGLSGTWRPVTVEAARSGELAYSSGTYEISFDGPGGRRITDRGKYIEIWRKQPDGSWKMITESFNTDDPAPGAPN